MKKYLSLIVSNTLNLVLIYFATAGHIFAKYTLNGIITLSFITMFLIMLSVIISLKYISNNPAIKKGLIKASIQNTTTNASYNPVIRLFHYGVCLFSIGLMYGQGWYVIASMAGISMIFSWMLTYIMKTIFVQLQKQGIATYE